LKIQINIHVYHDFTISQTMNHSLLQRYKITAATCEVSSTVLKENYLCGLRNSMASFFLWSFFFFKLTLEAKKQISLTCVALPSTLLRFTVSSRHAKCPKYHSLLSFRPSRRRSLGFTKKGARGHHVHGRRPRLRGLLGAGGGRCSARSRE